MTATIIIIVVVISDNNIIIIIINIIILNLIRISIHHHCHYPLKWPRIFQTLWCSRGLTINSVETFPIVLNKVYWTYLVSQRWACSGIRLPGRICHPDPWQLGKDLAWKGKKISSTTQRGIALKNAQRCWNMRLGKHGWDFCVFVLNWDAQVLQCTWTCLSIALSPRKNLSVYLSKDKSGQCCVDCWRNSCMLYVMVVEEPVEMRSMFLINSTLRPVWTLQRRRKSVGLNGTPAEKCGFPAETCGMLHFGKCCCHSFLPHCNMWVLLHSIPVELIFARSNYKTIVYSL